MSVTTPDFPARKEPKRRSFRAHGIPYEWTLDDINKRFASRFPAASFTFSSMCRAFSGDKRTAVLTVEPPFPEDLRVNVGIPLDGHRIIIESCDGLTSLFEPPDGDPITADIVFVHGLSGHSVGSWTNHEGYCWPRDALGNHLRNVRILTFGYEAKLNEDTSTSVLSDFGVTLLNELGKARKKPEHQRRPLLLIGHSFGGTVIAWALNELARRKQVPELDNTLRAIRGVTFFGAPHMGMSIEYLEPLTRKRKHESMRRTLEDLRPNSELLRTLRATLADLHDIRFITCLEQKLTLAQDAYGNFTGESYKAVEPNSARLHARFEKVILIAADHRNMIKFSHEQERHYELIRDELQSTLYLCRQINLPCLTSEQRKILMDSLRASDIGNKGLENRPAVAGTSEWILDHAAYHNWRSGSECTDAKAMFLCIKGCPGSGKSTLIQHALERHKAQRGDHYVASFFFNEHGPYSQRNVSYMYQSLLIQVLENMPRIPSEAVSIERLSLNAVWETYALRELLEYIIPLLDKPLFCFIDASGCQPMDLPDIIHLFDRIAKNCEHKTSLRVCFTYSNDEDLPEIVTQTAIISLEAQEQHRRDILRFMGQHLESGHHNSFERLDQLAQKAEANFLWAKLAIGLLQKDFSQAGNFQMGRVAVIERMQNLPRGLPQLFNYILNEAGRQQDNQFLLLLKSVNQSPKPPKAEEMYKLTRSTAEVFRRQTKEVAVQSILDLSRGLLEITGKKGRHVRFVHSCIPQLLESLEIVGGANERSLATSPGVAHDRIKNDCIELLRRLNDDMIDLETATYAVENVIPNADEAQRLGVSQADFVTSFPVAEWIQLTNIITGYNRFAENTSLTYVLADMNMSHLILAHPASLQSYLLPNSGMLGTPLFVALAKMNKETLFAFLKLERGRTKPLHPYYNSEALPDEHAELCAQYFELLQEAHQTGTLKHILSPESSKLSDMGAVIAFMKRPGNEILHLYLMLAGRVDMNRQAFETAKTVAQVKKPLLLEYPCPPMASQITSRGMADGSMSQSASQIQPRGAAQEYYDSFKTHPDGHNSHQIDAPVESAEKKSKALDALEMGRLRLPAGKSAERLVEHPLQKGDALFDIKKAKIKSEKHRKAATLRKPRADKKGSALGYASSDEEESSKKVLSSKSKKHHVKPRTKSDGQRGNPNATHKGKQRKVKARDAQGPKLGTHTKAGTLEVSKTNKYHSDQRHVHKGHSDKGHSDKGHSDTRTLFVTDTSEIQTSILSSSEQQKLHGLRILDAHVPPKGPQINDLNAASEDCGSDEVSSSDSSSSSDTSSDSTSSEDSQSSDEDDFLNSTPRSQVGLSSQSPGPVQDHQKTGLPLLDDIRSDDQSVRGDMQAPKIPMSDTAINQHNSHSIRNHYETSAFILGSREEVETRHMNHHHRPEDGFSPVSPLSVYPSITSTGSSQANSPSSHGSTSSSSSSSSGDESSDKDRNGPYTQHAGVDMTSAGEGSDSEADDIYSPAYGYGPQHESSDSSNDDDDDGGQGEADEIEDSEDSDVDVEQDDFSDNDYDGVNDGRHDSSGSAAESGDDQFDDERYDSDSD